MDIIRIVLTILVGALIGYVTNYIAIKMLFRPKKEVKIKGKTIPFTPGIIPKNQSRLASAVGKAVGESLLTKEDIKNTLFNETITDKITEDIINLLWEDSFSMKRVIEKSDIVEYEVVNNQLTELLSNKIVNGIQKADITKIIEELASNTIIEKTKGTMLAMFINNDTIKIITSMLSDSIENYIDNNGKQLILPIVQEEVNIFLEQPVHKNIESINLEKAQIRSLIKKMYNNIINDNVDKIFSYLDISKLVEEKVNEMDIDELEDLVMSVMKNELQAIINLGAVIGAIIGIINIFI